MADVMVVAIFMVYLGFNGIITNQFEELQLASQDVTACTVEAQYFEVLAVRVTLPGLSSN